MMVSFCAVFFPRGVLAEILNLIESVSEVFPSYTFISEYVLIANCYKKTAKNDINEQTYL